jgi:hypothetical protein
MKSDGIEYAGFQDIVGKKEAPQTSSLTMTSLV